VSEQTRAKATIKEICGQARTAAAQNLAAAAEILVKAGPQPEPMALRAARLYPLAAGMFAVVAASGAGEPIPDSEIPNSEKLQAEPGGAWVM
jgi:hypothetical protein